jgi:hypothetical protein
MSLWMMLRQWLVENLSPMNTLVSQQLLRSRTHTQSQQLITWLDQLLWQCG